MATTVYTDTFKPVETIKPVPTVPSLPVPAFADIAKTANDLINKDFYHTAAALLEVKLKAPSGVSFTAKGRSPHEGPTGGSIEGKKILGNGITVTQAWTTANILDTKVELDGTFASGLKAEVLNGFSPEHGLRGQRLNLYFKQPGFHLRSFFDLSPAGNLHATIDGVIGHEGFLAGAEAGYDVQKAAVTRYAAAVGYSNPVYSAAITATNNLSVFSALYYQRINSAVEFGAKASMDQKSQQTIGLELASKYKLDPLSFAKVKINDRGIASLAYNTKLNSGFTFGIGASFDTQKLNQGGHKIGTSFTFEA